VVEAGAVPHSGAHASAASAQLWALVRKLLVDLRSSPLKLTARVARWSSCWPMLQSILRERASDPLGGRATSEAAAATEERREETQHEAFLTMCGLNPWAARRISQHYSLCDLLSLTPRMRLAHFAWVPERALRALAFVADGDSDEKQDGAIVAGEPTHDRSTAGGVRSDTLRANNQHAFHGETADRGRAAAYAVDERGQDIRGNGLLDTSGRTHNEYDHSNGCGAAQAMHDIYGGLDRDLFGGFVAADGSSGQYGQALSLTQQCDAHGQRQLCWGVKPRGDTGPSTSGTHGDDEWCPDPHSAFAAAAFAAAWALPAPPQQQLATAASASGRSKGIAGRGSGKSRGQGKGVGRGRGGGRGRRGARSR